MVEWLNSLVVDGRMVGWWSIGKVDLLNGWMWGWSFLFSSHVCYSDNYKSSGKIAWSIGQIKIWFPRFAFNAERMHLKVGLQCHEFKHWTCACCLYNFIKAITTQIIKCFQSYLKSFSKKLPPFWPSALTQRSHLCGPISPLHNWEMLQRPEPYQWYHLHIYFGLDELLSELLKVIDHAVSLI